MSNTDISTNSKLFICRSCSKSFTRKDYLYRHEKNHSQVKPFKCEQCNLFFTRSDLLTKHYKSKSHQRIRNELTNIYLNESYVNREESVNNNHGKFEKMNRINKRRNLSKNSSNSIFTTNLKNTEACKFNQINEKESMKYKRLGISNFLNRNSNDENIPTPPPQPSIILPSISKTNNFTGDSSNIFLKSQENVKGFTINGYISKTQTSNSNNININNNSNSTNISINNTNNNSNSTNNNNNNYNSNRNSNSNRNNDSSSNRNNDSSSNNNNNDNNNSLTLQTPINQTKNTIKNDINDISDRDTEFDPHSRNGIIDNDLLWLFNDSKPIDNLLWLFSDPIFSNNDNGSDTSNTNNLNDKNSTSNLSQNHDHINNNNNNFISTNNFDISSIMYQNLYNETTNTKISNNKINMKESTRSRILNIFPTINQLNDIPLERFEEYLDLYWFNFAQTFPVIHQATFNPNTINIYLLISMIVIGMAHSLDKVEYETSIMVNKKFRRVIYDIIEDNIELSLPILQALILHNFSAKNFGDTQLSKIAQIDHGSNIMYLKFSGFLNNLTEPLVNEPTDENLTELTEQWQNWIYYESCKRIVFFEFICDTQHVTFSKIRALSAFDIKFELPCSDEVWNCAEPYKFFEEYQKQPKGLGTNLKIDISRNYFNYKNKYQNNLSIYNQENNQNIYNQENNQNNNLYTHDYNNVIDNNLNDFHQYSNKEDYLTNYFNIKTIKNKEGLSKTFNNNNSQQTVKMVSKWPTFLWSLRAMMTTYKANQKEYPLECYSLYSRYIILHGLLRICWDMRGHGLLDLGFVSKKKLSEFFKKLENAFLNWKGYFDLHVKLYEEQVISNKNVDDKRKTINHSILSLNNYGPTNASWANISFYYTGLFCLYADIPSITIFATEYKNFQLATKTIYKGIKEIEYEQNNRTIEQWVSSIYGEKAIIEACKFLKLVYGNEETINTFSHIPQTVFLAALIVWCYEIKRNCPSIKILNKGSKEEVKRDKIKLNANKYFDLLGNINYELSKIDAWKYFSMILNLKNDINDGINDNINDNINLDQQNNQDFNSCEEFIERQKNTIGVVCYVLHLLRNCKWVYSIDLVQQLEHVILTYEKL